MDEKTPKEPKAAQRAEKEWKKMEREVKQEAHDLVQNTPSRAEEDDSQPDA